MRKLNSIFLLTLLLISISCNRDSYGLNDIKDESISIGQKPNINIRELYSQDINNLSTDEDFIALEFELNQFFEGMPNKDDFHQNYNEATFLSLGESYFLNLSGYSNDEVTNKVMVITELKNTLKNRYAALRTESPENILLIIEEAWIKRHQNGPLDPNNDPNVAPNPCQQCAKTWRPRMIQATVAGGIVGGATGGVFGGWGGAVLGFVSAGWGAVDCLKAAGC